MHALVRCEGLLPGMPALLRELLVLALGGIAFVVLWCVCARIFLPSYLEVVLSPVMARLRHGAKNGGAS